MQLVDFPCNLCESKNTKTVYPSTITDQNKKDFAWNCTNDGHGEYFQVVRCKSCGLAYSSPRPNFEDLLKGYSEVQDEIYEKEIDGRIKTFNRNLDHISRYKNEGDLLDVGSSIGVFLKEAQSRNFNCEGIEPSHWCVGEAKRLFNVKARQGVIEDLKTCEKRYDVVTLWDVLEHLDNPLEALTLCGSVLKEDGVFAFSTVDFGSLYAKIMGKRWPWLMKMHIYYFDKKTLKQYLDKAGLELLEFRTYKHTVSFDYFLYKLKSLNSFGFNVMSFIKKTILFNKNPYITFGLGDFIEVYAKRK